MIYLYHDGAFFFFHRLISLRFSFLYWLFLSIISENFVRLKSSMFSALLASDMSPFFCIQSLLSGEFVLVMLSVLLLHFAGFFIG